ncbi:MAG TPA: hypothetical protein VKR54_03765 [Candidatus Babeliales bacterium]|nr:hypothetical protein [Candidatus Babeliales bacterium]
MKYRNVRSMVSMFFVLPLMMNGMNGTLALSKKLPQKQVPQRLCSTTMSIKLLKGSEGCFFDPFSAVMKTIPDNLTSADTLDLMEKIVVKAIAHKQSEDRYANVLRVLRELLDPKSYKVGLVLGQDMVHLAVDNKLESVTDQLLICNKEWVDHRDAKGRIPLHYAKSLPIAQHLLFSGSKVNEKDTNNNTPLHFVPNYLVGTLLDFGARGDVENKDVAYVPSCGLVYMNPLRKAVFDGDFPKVNALAWRMPFDQEEGQILHGLAGWKHERTGEAVFLAIQEQLDNAKKYWWKLFEEKCLE